MQGRPIIVTFGDKQDKEYPSATRAAVELNISISTVRKRLRSGEEYDLDGKKLKFRLK